MKIAFDAKRITHNKTGLGNYSRFVVNGLSTYFPANEYMLYTPGEKQNVLSEQIRVKSNITFHYPETLIAQMCPSLWRSRTIVPDLRREHVDLFHGLSNELPHTLQNSAIPSVVTIHDLIFLRYPQLYKFIDRTIYAYKFRKACQTANRIIAISEMTRQDIHSFFHIPEEKIDIIYQGCNPIFKQTVTEESKQRIREKYNIRSPYILYVGSIEPRKNLLLLAKALKEVKEDISLIAIGRRTPYADQIATYLHENNMSGRIRLLSNISFEELPVFYHLAELFVYPSYFEGFGIPILEALNANVPVIGATGSCLEEAGGPNSLYTNPDNPRELAALIRNVLHDSTLADTMRREGKIYAEKFTSERLSAQMMQLYSRL